MTMQSTSEFFTHQLSKNDELFDAYSTALKFENNYVPGLIDVFVVMEGEHFTQFAKKYLIKDIHQINAIPAAKVKMYKLPNVKNILICTSTCTDMKMYGEVMHLLEDYIKSSKLSIAFQTVGMAFYKTSQKLEVDSIIRALYSEKCKDKLSIPTLELPNFITGLTAGVQNQCDFYEKSGAVFVFYISKDQYGLDANKAKKISKILEIYNIPLMSRLMTYTEDKSNMYA